MTFTPGQPVYINYALVNGACWETQPTVKAEVFSDDGHWIIAEANGHKYAFTHDRAKLLGLIATRKGDE